MEYNFHTHTYLCKHATGFIEDYVKVAISRGFKILGMSDHTPYLESVLNIKDRERLMVSRHMNMEEFENVYLPAIKEAKEKYKDKITIYSGVEAEFLSNKVEYFKEFRSKLDYMNLGLHYFEYKGKLYNTYFDVNSETVIGYAETVENALKTGIYDFLVHPDLFMYDYVSSNGNHLEFDSVAEKVSRRIIEAAIKYDVPIEVNGGGVQKGKVTSKEYAYPRSEFWRIANEYKDLKIVMGRDAHNPGELGDYYTNELEEFIKMNKINVMDVKKVKLCIK